MIKLFLYFLPLVCILAGCNNSTVSPSIPNVVVSEQIPVNSLQYPELRQDGGYVYLNSGYKGIIVVRENANTYLAFERACPYDPTASCALVKVDQSRLFLIDECCKSQFNFQGNVTAGPAVYGLKRYQTALSGNLLYISN
ncbi:Rieske (2Fe-2S) protein [Pontibacter arcticus]|uniref:hypothetical protein n=1 Tax=Pontibacter arcticus TaxID=2080288 RepID=UPI001EF02418|nr:hypothetical protein [Pontibacter arcticus]